MLSVSQYIQNVEPTTYETLESLMVYLVRRLYTECLRRIAPKSDLRLRVEKPLAISFADAPAVEIFRTAEQLENL